MNGLKSRTAGQADTPFLVLLLWAFVGISGLLIGGHMLGGLEHGGASTLLLGASIVVYAYVQWKVAAKLTGTWRFTSLLPVLFVGSCVVFFLAIGPITPLDWWVTVAVIGLVCVAALLYLGLFWMFHRFAHADDRMARAMDREEAP